MRPGNLGMAMERVKRFDSGPTPINTTAGNTFYHGFAKVPSQVAVRLVCALAANGYVIGEEIPLEQLIRVTAGNKDGGPRWVVRVTDQAVAVLVLSTSLEIIDSAGDPVAVTLTNYRLRVTCLDVFPIG